MSGMEEAVATAMEETDKQDRVARQPRVGQAHRDWVSDEESDLPKDVQDAALTYGEAVLRAAELRRTLDDKKRDLMLLAAEVGELERDWSHANELVGSAHAELQAAVAKEVGS